MRSVYLLLLFMWFSSCIKSMSCVSQDRDFLKPCCKSYRIWLFSRWVIISDGGSVEFHNWSSVRIGWCIPCDFADYNRFTHIHWIKYFLCPGRTFRSIWVFFLCPCVKGNNWFSYITLGKTYCQSSRRLSVSETPLACGLVVHTNLVIACFVQASDDRLLKMRIDHHNQQLLRLINRLFPIIGTSLVIMLLVRPNKKICLFPVT